MDSITADTASKPLKEITVKSALHFHVNEMPCNWDVNVYRGCGHGCRYCFAQYSHEYLGSGNFFGEIYAKVNVTVMLDRELSFRKGFGSLGLAAEPARQHKAEVPSVPGGKFSTVSGTLPGIVSRIGDKQGLLGKGQGAQGGVAPCFPGS